MRLSVAVGGLASLGAIVVGIVSGSSLLVFFDATCVLLLVTMTTGFVLQAHGVEGLWLTVRAVRSWVGGAALVEHDRHRARVVVSSGARGTVLAAAVGLFIGAVQILQSAAFASEERIHVLGPALAVMLLMAFYALVLNLVFFGPLSRSLTEPDAAHNAR